MIIIPFLDLTVPKDQYYHEAVELGEPIALKTISVQEAMSREFEHIVISDQCLDLSDIIKAKRKFLWVIEPPSINIRNYQVAHNLRTRVELIFSHTKAFLSETSNSVYCPWGSYFIQPNDHQVYPKNCGLTIIASNKTFAYGHRMRHEVISKYKDYFSCIRNGGSNHAAYQNGGAEYKLNFLRNYRFSVEIENAPIAGYFTEKLLDCFRTGTIPIYCGDPNIESIFNNDASRATCTKDLHEVL